MKTKQTVLRFSLGDSLDVSNLLELSLSNCSIDPDRSIRYTLLVEEALAAWREALPAENELVFIRRETPFRLFFTFEIRGEKHDPLALLPGGGEDFSITDVMDRLKSGIGHELSYRYRNGKNRLTLFLPKGNTEKRLFRYNLLVLMLPLTMQALMASVATNIDTLMLGFLDTASMSGVSLASVFITIFTCIITGIISASTALLAQYWGKRDRNSINQVVSFSLLIALFLSGLFCFAGLVFPNRIFSLYSNDAEIFRQGALYLRWIAPSFVVTGLYRMLFCYMETLGSVKKALRYSVIGCLSNVFFNALFIFGFGMFPSLGAKGAALATCLSAVIQAVLAIRYLGKSRLIAFRFTLRYTIDIGHFLKNFAAIVGQTLIWIVANNIINAAIGHMNRDIVSANSVLLVLSGFIVTAKTGFGKSVSLLIGGYLGKNRLALAKERSVDATRFGAVIALFLAPLFLLLGFSLRFLPMDFTPEAIRYMNPLLLVYGVNIFFNFFNGLFVFGLLHTGGDSVSLLIIDTVVMWGVMVPISLAVIYIPALPVLPLLMLLKTDEILSCPFKYLRVKQYKWLVNLTEKKAS